MRQGLALEPHLKYRLQVDAGEKCCVIMITGAGVLRVGLGVHAARERDGWLAELELWARVPTWMIA